MAFYRVAPWGDDYLALLIGQLNVDVQRAHFKHPQRLNELVPHIAPREMTPEEIHREWKNIKALHGGHSKP